MASINYERLIRDIESKRLSPFYAFFGEESFLVDEAVKKMTETALDGGLSDFNLDVFYGGDVDGVRVREAIETLPMMSPRRVVVVKASDHLKAKDLDAILPAIENPYDSAVAVFVFESIDQRKKFFKLIEKNGQLVKFERLADERLLPWVFELAQRTGKKISAEAARLMIQMVGSSLLDLNNECVKLSQFVGSNSEITVDDVKQVVSHSRVESVFGLAHAIGEKDKSKALLYLANLLDHGESEVGILALISRHIRILMNLRDGVSQGIPKAQLSAKVGVPGFFLQSYLEQVRTWTPEQLEKTHEALVETDRALKSSSVSGHIWLENFILKCC